MRSATQRLRAAGFEKTIEALARTCTLLTQSDANMIEALSASTGLSAPMVAWALETSLRPYVSVAAWDGVRESRPRAAHAVPPDACMVVLAANVFTAAFRAVAFPLLSGTAVLIKASSRESHFAELMTRAFTNANPELEGALQLVTWSRESFLEEPAFQTMLDLMDQVIVYGSDATLASFQQRLAPSVRYLPHGHGLGVAYIAHSVVTQPAMLERALAGLALDIAAYDQRGCLSPQAVWVEVQSPHEFELVAQTLFTALGTLSQRLPRGALDVEQSRAQWQWRMTSAGLGELHEGDGYAVNAEKHVHFRPSPGARNISVYACTDRADFLQNVTSLARHIKCIGVAGHESERLNIAEALRYPFSARVCAVGAMQTPPLHVPWDGDSPWHGLTKTVHLS